MNLVLFGAPGSGKGTQAIILSERFNLTRISLGDILRSEVKENTPLGQEVKSYMEKGALVPDALVAKVIENHIKAGGFILDGYPRNLAQAKTLAKILQKNKIEIDRFIYLEADRDTVVNRLSKRIVCKSCGANYHLQNMPPKKAGICDKCSGQLIQRKDDNPEVILKRWEVFLKESKDLIEFYQKQGKLFRVDGSIDKDLVFEKIKLEVR